MFPPCAPRAATVAGARHTDPDRIRRLALPTLLLALLAFGGCALNRPLARQAEAVVAATRPATLDCARADHCALPTPYRAFAEESRASAAPLHYVNLLERGEDALALRVHLIRAARRSIDIQTFIWTADDAGWLMLDELLAAARRGVRVRVLADQLFALEDAGLLARLARAHRNLEVRVYNPTFHKAVTPPLEFAAGLLCCFTRFNQRMHNKLFLVDGEIGIAGGRNVENRYFDWDTEFDYRDRDALVVGRVAGQAMSASFEQFWRHPRATALTRLNDVNAHLVADDDAQTLQPPEHLDAERVRRLRALAGDPARIEARFAAQALRVGAVEYFSDAPGKPDGGGGAALSQRIAGLIAGARSQIAIQTPYLVLSGRARTLFAELHRRKPAPQVIVSTNSLASTDAFYVYALSHKYKKRFLKRYGFWIYESKPFPGDAPDLIADYESLGGGGASGGAYQRYGRAPLNRGGVRVGMHAKSIVIDEAVTLIGSHNFDPRSDHYNTESGFIIHDAAVARQVRAAILRDTEPQNAWTIARRERMPLIWRINNSIGDLSTALPLFDLWPFRYATSFEIDEGCAPLPPNDPGFYDCYHAVGDFPDVDLPLKSIYTRIVTAFGAGLSGIL